MRHNINREKLKCKGLCCKDFMLDYSPEELKKLTPDSFSKKDDIGKVQKMVQYLGYYSINPEIFKFKYIKKSIDDLPKGHHYKCSLQDPHTGLCADYKNRPGMCRKFPNGEPCPYEGCEHN